MPTLKRFQFSLQTPLDAITAAVVAMTLLMTLSMLLSSPARASVTAWVDFQIVDGFVVIPTAIQGIEGYSVIDTGAQFTGIAESFVKKNKLELLSDEPMKIIGVNGSDSRLTYKNVPVTLMGAELTFGRLVNLDLGPRPQLLIGGDFLRTLYFQFDYPNKRLRAISKEAFNLKKISNVKTKMDPLLRQPLAKVRLNDEHDTWLVIDTGSTGGILMERRPAKKKKWLEKFPTEQTNMRGITTAAKVERFRLPVMAIGDYNVRNVPVTVPVEGERLSMLRNKRGAWGTSDRPSKVRGLLGYEVLKNFLVTFDYQTGSIFIELPPKSEKESEKEAAKEPAGG